MYESIFRQIVQKDAPLPFELPQWIALAPFEEFLGMRIDCTNHGESKLSMPFPASHCQGMGLMHGGAVVSLADTALAIAIKTMLPEGTHFATIDMSLEFHAPIRWGAVQAHAKVTKQVDRDLHGEVKVFTEEGVNAATFRAKFRVKRSQTTSIDAPVNL
jgi:uncharacterized protein (TIGR00369 family)